MSVCMSAVWAVISEVLIKYTGNVWLHMKDIISKLQQKMEEADRTEREADQGRKCWL